MQHHPQRSLLFVPGTHTHRITKALDSDADTVIVDLEDAVAPADKATAREALAHFLATSPAMSLIVRVNAATHDDTDHFQRDLALCTDYPAVMGIMLPKAESAEQVALAARSGKPVWPLIETARGITALAEIAAAPGVARLVLGALDMTTELNMEPGSAGAESVLDHCRHQLLLHSRAQALPPPIESVVPEIQDLSAVSQTAQKAMEMGFSGMLCIHPRQVAAIHAAFTPDDAALEWAQRVVALAAKQGGAFQLDGKMIDAPVIARAETLIARAAAGR